MRVSHWEANLNRDRFRRISPKIQLTNLYEAMIIWTHDHTNDSLEKEKFIRVAHFLHLPFRSWSCSLSWEIKKTATEQLDAFSTRNVMMILIERECEMHISLSFDRNDLAYFMRWGSKWNQGKSHCYQHIFHDHHRTTSTETHRDELFNWHEEWIILDLPPIQTTDMMMHLWIECFENELSIDIVGIFKLPSKCRHFNGKKI